MQASGTYPYAEHKVTYAGPGMGWYVTARKSHGSWSEIVTVAGPYTAREQAEKVARELGDNPPARIRQGYPAPIAYTFEADYHCPACSAARFGVDEHGWIPDDREDAEGNPIGAVAPWDEWWMGGADAESLYCADCGGLIAEVEGLDEDEGPTVNDLARQAYEGMEQATRPDGSTYTRVKEAARTWMGDLVRNAHGDMLPDDWRYDCIRAALGAIADADEPDDYADEFADGYVDTFNAELLTWLGSNGSREGYVQEAREFWGEPADDIYEDIRRGQFMEAREVYDRVLRELEEWAGEGGQR